MCKPRVSMSAEVSLKYLAVFRAIENCTPGFELAHTIRRLLRVELGHPPVVDVLPAAHCVGEMYSPIVAIIDVRESSRHSALGHHRVRFAEQRLAYKPDANARGGRLNRRAQSGTSGTDDDHVVFVCLVICH